MFSVFVYVLKFAFKGTRTMYHLGHVFDMKMFGPISALSVNLEHCVKTQEFGCKADFPESFLEFSKITAASFEPRHF